MKIFRKKRLLCALCALFALLPTLSGCMSSYELDTIAFVSSTLYDLDEDGKVSITIEVIDPSQWGAAAERKRGRG